jgi:hypothetical protein
MVLVHSDSKNISPIADLTVGGWEAPNTAHCTYWSCHDMWRSQILNLSGSCRNCKMEPQWRFNPAIKLLLFIRSCYHPRQHREDWVFGRVWDQTKPNCWTKSGPLTRYPDPLVTPNAVHTDLHFPRQSPSRCRQLIPLSVCQYINVCMIPMWRPPPKCLKLLALCQLSIGSRLPCTTKPYMHWPG